MIITFANPVPSQISYASVDARIRYDIATDVYDVELSGILTTGDDVPRIHLVRGGNYIKIDRVSYTGTELDAQIASGDTRQEAHESLIKSKATAQINP